MAGGAAAAGLLSVWGGGGKEGGWGDGGIRVDVVTERRDGSLLVDVERHFVVCGGGGMEEEAGVVG